MSVKGIHGDEIHDLDVAVSESDEVKGGRPANTEFDYIGDSEQPNPSGPGSTGGAPSPPGAEAGMDLLMDAAGMAMDPMGTFTKWSENSRRLPH